MSVIDLPSLSAVATVPVGERPNGVSFSPRPPTATGTSTGVTLPPPAVTQDGSDEEHPDEHGP